MPLISLLIILNFTIIPLAFGADEYQLSIKENIGIIWEHTFLNKTLIQNLITEEGYGETLLEYEVGNQLKWDIDMIRSEEIFNVEYWLIFFSIIKGKNLEDVALDPYGECYTNIVKDPKDLFKVKFEDDDLPINLRILPVNAQKYLEVFVNNIPSANKSIFSSNKLVLIEDYTTKGKNHTIIRTFNEEGIISNYSLYYNGSLAYEYLLSKVIDYTIGPTILMSVFGAIVCIGLISLGLAVKKKLNSIFLIIYFFYLFDRQLNCYDSFLSQTFSNYTNFITLSRSTFNRQHFFYE